MNLITILAVVFTVSCSSKKYSPESVKEISRSQAEQCVFIDDLRLTRNNVSKQKIDLEIKLMVAEKKGNSFFVDERITNGKKTKIIGSMYNCSK